MGTNLKNNGTVRNSGNGKNGKSGENVTTGCRNGEKGCSCPKSEGLGAWAGIIDNPLPGRLAKPRTSGLTMLIDKGIGLRQTQDLLETCSDHIDLIKLGFGTAALYPPEILQQKIVLARSMGIDIYPGGTFMEIAVLQQQADRYLEKAHEMGFTCIEISDGTIPLHEELRSRLIKKAKQDGFKVITEVGKKDTRTPLSGSIMLQIIREDLENGAWKVIVEGRDSGKGVNLFDAGGNIKSDEFDTVLEGLEDPSRLIWEAPLKNQQEFFIGRFGPNVNLGNIPVTDVIALEALRTGLRSDTLRMVLASEVRNFFACQKSYSLNPKDILM